MSHSKMACEKHGHFTGLYACIKQRPYVWLISTVHGAAHIRKGREKGWKTEKNFLSPVEQMMVFAKSVPLELCIQLSSALFCSRCLSWYLLLSLCLVSVCLSLPCPQGFLKNERDNALLSAIEESRRRVSICPVSDWFSGRKRATDGWQNLNPIMWETSSRAPPDSDGPKKTTSKYYFHSFSFFFLKDKRQWLDSIVTDSSGSLVASYLVLQI